MFAELTSLHRPQELMIKRELAKDPKLAEENWDRFLPKFRRRREKKRGPGAGAGPSEGGVSGANAIVVDGAESQPPAAKKQKKDKKPYTPFPPAQMPSKVRPLSLALVLYGGRCTWS